MKYKAKWEIDVETEEGVVEAAKEAFNTMQRPGTTATVFTVENGTAVTEVDLSEYPLESGASKFLRKALVFAYNLDYDKFLEVMGFANDYYAKDKWKMMNKNFSIWFCTLDSEHAEKFCQGVDNHDA